MKKLWHEHSLGIVTLCFFLAMTFYCLWAGHQVWAVEGEKTNGPFWIWWSWEYNISLVADVFGGLYLIYATKHLREQGSSQSGGES